MPLSVHVDQERNAILVRCWGILTTEEVHGYVAEYLDRRRLRHMDELFDLAKADLRDLTPMGLAKIAEAAVATDLDSVPTKIALLVSESSALGFSRMYQILREDKGGRRSARVFTDRAASLKWLGLPPDWHLHGKAGRGAEG